MIIHLLDDQPNHITAFKAVTIDQVKNKLERHSDTLANRFLSRNKNISIDATQVTDYASMQTHSNTLANSSEQDTILLLDCHIDLPLVNFDDIAKNISDIIKSLPCRNSLTLGLTTTKFNPFVIVQQLETKSPCHLPLLKTGLTDCSTSEKSLKNIVNAILHWEYCQNTDGKYNAFINELFFGDDADIVNKHPGDFGDNERINIFDKHFPEIRRDLNFKEKFISNFINRQIYEMAYFDAPQGMGLESIWLLAIMKAYELFPDKYMTSFSITEQFQNWLERVKRNGVELPFIPPQSQEDRIQTLKSFGEFCNIHFVHKNTHEFTLKKVDLGFDNFFSVIRVTFNFNWSAPNYAQNVFDLFNFIKEKLAASEKSRSKPGHNASKSLVSFLFHTTRSIETKENWYHLSGTCAGVRIKSTDSDTFLEFDI